MMLRRDFITLLGGAAAWPMAVQAQQPAMPVIGYLHSSTVGQTPSELAAFLHGLGNAGFVEGQTVVIAYRNASRFPWLPRYQENMEERGPGVVVHLVR
jgi:putative tryptophan/tyrosine transport system substrate-binding protein